MWIAALYDADDAVDYNEHQMMMEMMQMVDPEQDNADQQKQYEQEQADRDDAAQDWDEQRYWAEVSDPWEYDGYYDGEYGYPVEVMA